MCVVRYAAFVSLFTAIAGVGAVLLKQSPWVAGTLGFVLGAAIFRGKLRALSWPRLALSRDHVYLVRRNQHALVIPWEAITRIAPDAHRVMLEFVTELEVPGQGMIAGLGLDSSKLGVSANELAAALENARANRSGLPSDEEARRSIA